MNLSKLDDLKLMNLLASDDLGAWSELVRRYSNLIYSIAFQILKNANDTEDAVQNTFINLKIYSNKFDSQQELKPWLARIASIEAIRIYNKKKYITKKESVRMATKNPSHQSQRRDAAEIVEQKELEGLVKKAIDLLPEPTRVAITLYYAGGMNQTEIANELDLSQDVISRKIKSGLEYVKNYLESAGVHASIILSPNLVQECFNVTKPSNDFIHKLTNQLPTDADIARATAKSVRRKVAVASHKGGLFWLWPIFGLISFSLMGYFYLASNNEKIIQPTTPAKSIALIKDELGFLPIDYNNYTPMYFKMGKIQSDLSKPNNAGNAPIIYMGGDSNWSKPKDSKDLNTIRRSSYAQGGMDGLYIKPKFNSGCVFRGTIYIDSKDDRTGFLMSTPLNKTEQHNAIVGKENASYDVADRIGQLGDFNTDSKSEIEFKIYIWPDGKNWKSASFFKDKNEKLFTQVSPNSLPFLNQVFKIGLFSTGKTEFRNFEYSQLPDKWDPIQAEEIKQLLDNFPIGFFDKPKN